MSKFEFKRSLADTFGVAEEAGFTREQKENFPKDGAFYAEEKKIGRVISMMDKIRLIKEKVEHSHHYFNAPMYYIPTEERVAVNDMYAITPEMMKVWEDIEAKVKDSQLKNFLRIRFAQLVEIDFKKTADYYVNAPAEVKEIFERLALVVVDYERAILNGMFDIADSINEAGEISIHGSYFQKRNQGHLKKYQGQEDGEEEEFDEEEEII